jgi:transcriptional regulator with XRE-family HTH domain
MADAAPDAPWLRHLRAEVRARLQARHVTQVSLAAHLGITPKHINQILAGKVVGSPDLLARMAEAVGMQITVVTTGREPVPLAADRRPWKSGNRAPRAKRAAAELPNPAADWRV